MRKWVSAILAGTLAAGLLVPSVSAAPTIDITVVFRSGTLPANAAATIESLGGQVTSSVPQVGMMKVSGPASLLDKLNSTADIQAASPTIHFTVSPVQQVEFADDVAGVNTAAADLYNRYQWDIKQVTNNGASWDLNSGSHQTVVGIVDTGVDSNHAALKANFLGGRNFVPAGANGDATETGNPSDFTDRHGHGSHVAGTIAGNGRILGVAPNIGFRSYRVFGATGGAPTDWIAAAVVAATDDNVDVISLSIGGYDGMAGYIWTDPATGVATNGKDVADFIAWKRAVQYAVNHGVTVVAAAGNEATNTANPTDVTAYLNAEYGSQGYQFWGASREVPGTLPGVVTVSATGPDKSLASYSNYGPGAIDLAAPGGEYIRGIVTEYCLSAYKNGGYVWMVGTSMATPKVSAVAALIVDRAKAAGQKLSPSQVTAKLQQTSVDIGQPGADPFFGHGMVNAYSALSGK
jgi:lantibiotic leader peptide-processing serine protease